MCYCSFRYCNLGLEGQKKGLPLQRLLNFPPPSVPTSITLGINSADVVKDRIPLMLEGKTIKLLKVKLGSPMGIEADQEMFSQVIESTQKYNIKIRVDANGGWSTSDAIYMMKWLADLGVEHIEQPIKEGKEEDLKYLFHNRPLPIYIDESCRYAEDVAEQV